jgi:hypothetical protein
LAEGGCAVDPEWQLGTAGGEVGGEIVRRVALFEHGMAVDSQPGNRAERRVLVVMALVVAGIAVWHKRQADPDLWGHLRYGRFFAEIGIGDFTDPFAYTSTGLDWLAHEWLAQWLLWQVYALGGALGLIGLKCVVGGAAMWFLSRAVRLGSDEPRIWVPVFVLAAEMLAHWYYFRPQLFTYCFFAYFVWIVFAHLFGRPAWLWTLPPLLTVWANVHGGFLAGLGAIGLALGLRVLQAYERTGLRAAALWSAAWPLILTLVAGFGATLLNPFGLGLWRYVLTELTHSTNRELIDEWMPLLHSSNLDSWTVLLVVLLLGVLLFAWLMAQSKRASIADLPAWLWLLSCLPLTWMAFGSIRHVPILTIWTAPVASLLAQAAASRWGPAKVWETGWLALTGLMALPAFVGIAVVLSHPAPRIPAGPFPFQAAAFMRVNQLQGNVFAPLWWGSFLTWQLYPDVRVSMDGRNVTLYPSAMVRENVSYVFNQESDPDVPLHYPTDFLLLPVDAVVVERLRRDPRWQVLYEDREAILLVCADDAHVELLRRFRAGELKQPRTARPVYFE